MAEPPTIDDRLREAGETIRRWWQDAVAPRLDAARRRLRQRRRGTRTAPDTYTTVVATREDDLSSITGRIDTATDMTVVLLVPRAARQLQDPGLWPHIAAHARRRGIWLGVVSPRSRVRTLARENGLASGTSIDRVFRPRRYRIPFGDQAIYLPRIPWAALVRGLLLAGVVTAAVVVGCYAVPSAEVVVVPESEPLRSTLRVRLSPSADEPDLGTRLVPAESLERTIRTVVSTTTSGETEVGDQPATVELEMTNETREDVTIPARTIVSTEEGVEFATDVQVVVPAGATELVPATATMPGEIGNVPAATIRLVSELPAGVSAVNQEPATGGTDKLVPAVAAEDADRVRAIANRVLRQIGEQEIAEHAEVGTVFPSTLSIAIFSEEPLTEIGEASEAFLMQYTVVLRALYLTDRTARAFGELMLRDALPAGQALVPDSTTVSVRDPRLESGIVTVELSALGRVAPYFDAAEVSDALVGVTLDQARERLRALLDLERPPRITLAPEFIPWQRLPRRAERITIRLATAESLEAEEAEDDADPDSANGEDEEAPASPTPRMPTTTLSGAT